jgi:protein TonB
LEKEEQPVFTIVEEMPTYPGGDAARLTFISKNISYPQVAKESGIQGTVYITMYVEENGKLTDIKVAKGIGGGCDEEAMRIVKMMPNWKPGKQAGIPVKVKYSLPIRFVLN